MEPQPYIDYSKNLELSKLKEDEKRKSDAYNNTQNNLSHDLDNKNIGLNDAFLYDNPIRRSVLSLSQDQSVYSNDMGTNTYKNYENDRYNVNKISKEDFMQKSNYDADFLSLLNNPDKINNKERYLNMSYLTTDKSLNEGFFLNSNKLGNLTPGEEKTNIFNNNNFINKVKLTFKKFLGFTKEIKFNPFIVENVNLRKPSYFTKSVKPKKKIISLNNKNNYFTKVIIPNEEFLIKPKINGQFYSFTKIIKIDEKRYTDKNNLLRIKKVPVKSEFYTKEIIPRFEPDRMKFTLDKFSFNTSYFTKETKYKTYGKSRNKITSSGTFSNNTFTKLIKASDYTITNVILGPTGSLFTKKIREKQPILQPKTKVNTISRTNNYFSKSIVVADEIPFPKYVINSKNSGFDKFTKLIKLTNKPSNIKSLVKSVSYEVFTKSIYVKPFIIPLLNLANRSFYTKYVTFTITNRVKKTLSNKSIFTKEIIPSHEEYSKLNISKAYFYSKTIIKRSIPKITIKENHTYTKNIINNPYIEKSLNLSQNIFISKEIIKKPLKKVIISEFKQIVKSVRFLGKISQKKITSNISLITKICQLTKPKILNKFNLKSPILTKTTQIYTKKEFLIEKNNEISIDSTINQKKFTIQEFTNFTKITYHNPKITKKPEINLNSLVGKKTISNKNFLLKINKIQNCFKKFAKKNKSIDLPILESRLQYSTKQINQPNISQRKADVINKNLGIFFKKKKEFPEKSIIISPLITKVIKFEKLFELEVENFNSFNFEPTKFMRKPILTDFNFKTKFYYFKKITCDNPCSTIYKTIKLQRQIKLIIDTNEINVPATIINKKFTIDDYITLNKTIHPSVKIKNKFSIPSNYLSKIVRSKLENEICKNVEIQMYATQINIKKYSEHFTYFTKTHLFNAKFIKKNSIPSNIIFKTTKLLKKIEYQIETIEKIEMKRTLIINKYIEKEYINFSKQIKYNPPIFSKANIESTLYYKKSKLKYIPVSKYNMNAVLIRKNVKLLKKIEYNITSNVNFEIPPLNKKNKYTNNSLFSASKEILTFVDINKKSKLESPLILKTIYQRGINKVSISSNIFKKNCKSPNSFKLLCKLQRWFKLRSQKNNQPPICIPKIDNDYQYSSKELLNQKVNHNALIIQKNYHNLCKKYKSYPTLSQPLFTKECIRINKTTTYPKVKNISYYEKNIRVNLLSQQKTSIPSIIINKSIIYKEKIYNRINIASPLISKIIKVKKTVVYEINKNVEINMNSTKKTNKIYNNDICQITKNILPHLTIKNYPKVVDTVLKKKCKSPNPFKLLCKLQRWFKHRSQKNNQPPICIPKIDNDYQYSSKELLSQKVNHNALIIQKNYHNLSKKYKSYPTLSQPLSTKGFSVQLLKPIKKVMNIQKNCEFLKNIRFEFKSITKINISSVIISKIIHKPEYKQKPIISEIDHSSSKIIKCGKVDKLAQKIQSNFKNITNLNYRKKILDSNQLMTKSISNVKQVNNNILNIQKFWRSKRKLPVSKFVYKMNFVMTKNIRNEIKIKSKYISDKNMQFLKTIRNVSKINNIHKSKLICQFSKIIKHEPKINKKFVLNSDLMITKNIKSEHKIKIRHSNIHFNQFTKNIILNKKSPKLYPNISQIVNYNKIHYNKIPIIQKINIQSSVISKTNLCLYKIINTQRLLRLFLKKLKKQIVKPVVPISYYSKENHAAYFEKYAEKIQDSYKRKQYKQENKKINLESPFIVKTAFRLPDSKSTIIAPLIHKTIKRNEKISFYIENPVFIEMENTRFKNKKIIDIYYYFIKFHRCENKIISKPVINETFQYSSKLNNTTFYYNKIKKINNLFNTRNINTEQKTSIPGIIINKSIIYKEKIYNRINIASPLISKIIKVKKTVVYEINKNVEINMNSTKKTNKIYNNDICQITKNILPHLTIKNYPKVVDTVLKKKCKSPNSFKLLCKLQRWFKHTSQKNNRPTVCIPKIDNSHQYSSKELLSQKVNHNALVIQKNYHAKKSGRKFISYPTLSQPLFTKECHSLEQLNNLNKVDSYARISNLCYYEKNIRVNIKVKTKTVINSVILTKVSGNKSLRKKTIIKDTYQYFSKSSKSDIFEKYALKIQKNIPNNRNYNPKVNLNSIQYLTKHISPIKSMINKVIKLQKFFRILKKNPITKFTNNNNSSLTKNIIVLKKSISNLKYSNKVNHEYTKKIIAKICLINKPICKDHHQYNTKNVIPCVLNNNALIIQKNYINSRLNKNKVIVPNISQDIITKNVKSLLPIKKIILLQKFYKNLKNKPIKSLPKINFKCLFEKEIKSRIQSFDKKINISSILISKYIIKPVLKRYPIIKQNNQYSTKLSKSCKYDKYAEKIQRNLNQNKTLKTFVNLSQNSLFKKIIKRCIICIRITKILPCEVSKVTKFVPNSHAQNIIDMMRFNRDLRVEERNQAKDIIHILAKRNVPLCVSNSLIETKKRLLNIDFVLTTERQATKKTQEFCFRELMNIFGKESTNFENESENYYYRTIKGIRDLSDTTDFSTLNKDDSNSLIPFVDIVDETFPNYLRNIYSYKWFTSDRLKDDTYLYQTQVFQSKQDPRFSHLVKLLLKDAELPGEYIDIKIKRSKINNLNIFGITKLAEGFYYDWANDLVCKNCYCSEAYHCRCECHRKSITDTIRLSVYQKNKKDEEDDSDVLGKIGLKKRGKYDSLLENLKKDEEDKRRREEDDKVKLQKEMEEYIKRTNDEKDNRKHELNPRISNFDPNKAQSLLRQSKIISNKKIFLRDENVIDDLVDVQMADRPSDY